MADELVFLHYSKAKDSGRPPSIIKYVEYSTQSNGTLFVAIALVVVLKSNKINDDILTVSCNGE